ncbi:MAG: DUF222 domain-containing protein, partial [Gemmatimonadota bacterium]|nr:DUF222 domain-containing protein [Gemmatimonadota bacterium]
MVSLSHAALGRPPSSGRGSAPAPAVAPLEPGAAPAGVRARRRWLAGVGDRIASISAHLTAATAEQLDLIRVFDEGQGWHEEGFTTCAAWLSWRIGVGGGTAREKVRVARALGELPHMRAAMGRGELSYSLARALTRVATPENEADLVEAARHTTAAQMERLVGAWRAADRAEDEWEVHVQRSVKLIPEIDGSWTLTARLDAEGGAITNRALAAARWASGPPARGDESTPEQRRADAFVLAMEAALGEGLPAITRADAGGIAARDRGRDPRDEASGAEIDARARKRVVSRADRFQVVLHVSAETLSGSSSARAAGVDGARTGGGRDSGRGHIRVPDPLAHVPRFEGGPRVSAETARRLACDAGVVTMLHGADGSVLDVGRRKRTVSTPLRRVLAHRDDGCRFPGCRNRYCDAHHATHWADGGHTAPDNLVLLCRHHHVLVHEGGWRMTLDEDGEVRFYRPDGSWMPEVPPWPAVPNRPVTELARRHASEGLEIDEWTATPRWLGDRFDVDWGLFVLRQPSPV